MVNLKVKKALAIFMVVNGMLEENVAKTVGVTLETISKWLNAHRNKFEREINEITREERLRLAIRNKGQGRKYI